MTDIIVTREDVKRQSESAEVHEHLIKRRVG